MKKISIALAALALAASALAQNNSPTAFRDPVAARADASIRARAAALEADVAAAQADLDAVEIVAAAAVPKASLVQSTTNNPVVATQFTPAFAGQILYGSASNEVWVAKGATTNDWVALKDPE